MKPHQFVPKICGVILTILQSPLLALDICIQSTIRLHATQTSSSRRKQIPQSSLCSQIHESKLHRSRLLHWPTHTSKHALRILRSRQINTQYIHECPIQHTLFLSTRNKSHPRPPTIQYLPKRNLSPRTTSSRLRSLQRHPTFHLQSSRTRILNRHLVANINLLIVHKLNNNK